MATYEDDLEYLVEYAEEDWVPISTVVGVAAGTLGCDPSLAQDVGAMLRVIGDLIDHGALPGELTDGEPAFKPWPGSKEELLDRFRNEMLELGRLPNIGELCWIHIPPGKRRYPGHTSSLIDYATGLQELIRIARIQGISMALVCGLSGHVLGPEAAFDQHIPVMMRIVEDLIDRGAVLRDMVDPGTTNPRERPIRAPRFQPWAGTKEDWITRFRAELDALGRLPDLGEIGWIHIPTPKTDQP